MEQKTLYFTANQQNLINNTENILFASNTVHYAEAIFELGENWQGYDSVRAVWKAKSKVVATVLDSEGKCVVPTEVLSRVAKVYVNLVGSIAVEDVLTDRLTTFPALAANVTKNALVTGTETVPITPSQFDQFTAIVRTDADRAVSAKTEAEASATSASASATSAQGYANTALQAKNDTAQLKTDVQGLKADVVTIKADVLDVQTDVHSVADNFDDAVETALGTIDTAKTGAVSDINTAKSGAISDIGTAKTSALSDIGSAKSSAISEIGTAKESAIDDVEDAGTDAVSDISTAKTSALSDISSGKSTALSEITSAKSSALSDITSSKASALTDIQTEGTTQKNLVTTEGQTQVANVQTEGETQIQAIEDKGAEVIASIPLLAPVITDTASGDIVSFTDGADGYPMKSVKVSLQPKQEGSGDPSPSNIRPISGYEGVTVYNTGVNIWDEEWEVISGHIESDGYIPVKPSTAYYWKAPAQPANGFVFYDSNKSVISTAYSFQGNIINTPSNCYFVSFKMGSAYGTTYNHDISINYPSTDHEYHSYHGQSHSISFPSTVYGGEIDVVSGEGNDGMGMVDMSTLRWVYNPSYLNCPTFVANAPTGILTGDWQNQKIVCECFKVTKTMFQASADDCIIAQAANGQLYAHYYQFDNVTDFKNAMNGLYLAYPLANPTPIYCDPTEINSYKGANTLWSDGAVECEYCADTKLYIDKKINALI